ncbi:hypothetical protein ABIE78_000756 [Sinorhizobium fredii]|uniref:Uncharacterized protein n=1 Tax=Sinorhizobium fredii (strain USDA 257) TaxID=1185652 RepID=I3XBU5_SINF2|nr:hypothetical protein [Sinorhizobium fredii]AFL53351.1 hypothetical protein USDA257_c48160 [Sinorhizobium fredii USDA 257]
MRFENHILPHKMGEIFSRVKVAYWKDEISQQAQETLEAVRQSPDELAYEDWAEHLSVGDWVLDFQVMSQGRKSHGVWQITKEHGNLSVAKPMARNRIEFDGNLLEFSEADYNAFESAAGRLIASHPNSDGRNVIIEFRDVILP